MNLPELIIKGRKLSLVNGNIKGICVICSKNSDKGHALNFSANFTNYDLLKDGNCMCPKCHILFEDQTYRRKSWLATEKEFKTGKAKELIQFLYDPVFPFSMYLTFSGKKQGYLLLIDTINTSDHIVLAIDYEIYIFDRKQFIKYLDEAKSLIGKGIFKKELISGEFRLKSLEKIGESHLKTLINKRGDRIWRLAIRLS